MYQNYKKVKNKTKSDKYKNLILDNFPESDYAHFIKDPDYFKEQASKQNEAENFYKKAWKAYEDELYDKVKVLADTGIKRYEKTGTVARLALLKAFAEGKSADSTSYVESLKFVVNNYKGSKPASKANQILNNLNSDSSGKEESDEKGSKEKGDKSYYTYEPDQMQLYIAIFNVKDLSMNEVKVAFSDFNNKFYSRKKLSVNTIYLDDKHQMVTVSRLDNAKQGLKYFRNIERNKELQKYFKNHSGKHFLVSVNDYSKFYKKKDVEKYMKFFEKNYRED